MRDGHNGYVPSAGIEPARRGRRGRVHRAAACPSRRTASSLTSGTSEGIELALSALVDAGDEVLRADADLSALHGRPGEDRRARRVLPHRSRRAAGSRISTTFARLITAAHARDRRDRSEQPDGRGLSGVDAPRARSTSPRRTGVPILADEVYSDVAFDGPDAAPRIARARRGRSSRSRRCRRRTSRPAGAPAGSSSARSDRLDDVLAAIRKMADGRLCSPGPDAVRGRAGALRRSLAPARRSREALEERAELTTTRISAIPGHALRDAARGVLRDAAGRSCRRARPTRTTSSGCFARPAILCVYGSGFGMPAEAGLLPHRVPRVAGGAERHLRRHGGVHARLPVAT